MSNTIRIDAPRGEDDDQKVADPINATFGADARITPKNPPPGSLTSIDPATQSFIIDILNSNALETILELTFANFIARKATKLKVGSVEVELKSDPKALARDTAKRLSDK